jgi:hypothetical protein
MSVDVGVDNGSEAWSASGSCSTMTSAVASIVHQANLPVTPRPAPDVDAAVPPEGKEVAFASDQYGDDFEIYTANVFTCEVQRSLTMRWTTATPLGRPMARILPTKQSTHEAE